MKDLTQHRTIAYTWAYMKTSIFGGHKWNFYKPIDIDTDRNIEKDCELYFEDYKLYKKQISNLCKCLKDFSWFPLDRYYIRATYGTDRGIVKDLDIDLTIKDGKEKMLKHGIIKEKDFLRWVLIVMDYEHIENAKTIVDNFDVLIEKFKIFIRLDMNPVLLGEYFNEKLSKLKDHNIEPIKNIHFKEFYYFVMQPEIYGMSIEKAIDRLFYHINDSDWLKGLASGINMKWSFKKYTEYLYKIFNCNYNNSKIMNNLDSFRRLKENEFMVYGDTKTYINTSYIIPHEIKQLYDLRIMPEDIKEPDTATDEDIQLAQKQLTETIETNKIKKGFSLENVAEKWKKYKASKKPLTKAEQATKKMNDAKKNLDQYL